MDVLLAVIAAAVTGAAGFAFGAMRGRAMGAAQGRSEGDTRLRALVEAVRRGRTLPGLDARSPEADLQTALEQGWAPREAERGAALREAVGRVSAFLQRNVRAPLAGTGPATGERELRDRIGRALGALEDLDFFVQETSNAREGTDLVALAQRVTHEFVTDQGVGVRLGLSDAAIRASANPSALMDALYLVLHNASRFGAGQTVDLGVSQEGPRAKITVRDRGPGFTEEAFRRAFDPFYSTSDDGMGLGLPHARKLIESMDGRIELRNMPDGGAEVEITLPAG
jgi:signal transduction histidine kinase